jgi:aspartyl-tRNA(Asn)/glutamyl-tRNA(Gln) amidotransferase subunit B
MPDARDILSVGLVVGLEVHVELSTRSKMFSPAPSPGHASFDSAGPNTLTDPTVLGLPGALPTMNKLAVEMAIKVGLALGCRIAPLAVWDRKNYFYPDMPKAYQISQYDRPLCGEGIADAPRLDERGLPNPDAPPVRVRILRAHLEEDAGKLLHEAPGMSGGGGMKIDGSIVDLNRAGTPLLEIVTQPDFHAADDVVAFARFLRQLCRSLGVTEGVMQKGHMRFEPNINTILTMRDGSTVATPIVEVKNLNSFKSVKGAIEYELAHQPARWAADGRVFGPGTKVTRGWDDQRSETYVQREKEDAHDYRYFPDPDLPPVVVDDAWRESIRATIGELPSAAFARYVDGFALDRKEAAALTEDPPTTRFYDACVASCAAGGMPMARAGRVAANLVLQAGAKRANEAQVRIDELGISPGTVAEIGLLREAGEISAASADDLFGRCAANPDIQPGGVRALATSLGILIVKDDAAMKHWCEEVLAANPKPAEDVRAGKVQAIGRLVGEVMKKAGGTADAKTVREALLVMLGVS